MGTTFPTFLKNDFQVEDLISALSEAGYAISIADAQQKDMPLVFINQAFTDITGYSQDEACGRNCRFLQGDATSVQTIEVIRKAIAKRQVCRVELINYTKAGEAYSARLTLVPVFDQSQQLRFYIGFQRNISAFRQLEASVKTSEQRFSSMVGAMQEGMVIQNSEAEIVEANPAAQEILGLTLSQLRGRTSVDESWHTIYQDGTLFPGHEHPAYQVLKTGEPVYKSVMGVVKPDKTTSWIQINACPLKSEVGEVSEVITSFSDITELRNKEEQLHKLNIELLEKIQSLHVLSKSFEYAQRAAKTGHWILEKETGRLTWSDEVYRIFGKEPQSFQASFETFMDHVHPEDRQPLLDVYNESVASKTNYQIEHRILLPNNEIGFVLERGFHDFDGEGKLLRSVGTLTDITEGRIKDFQVKSYVDIMNRQVIMSRTDLTGKILEVSDFFCEISGYSRQELLGQNQNIVRHPDTPDSLFKELWGTIQAEKVWVGEIKNLRKDGSFYWVESRISPEYDFLGNHIGYLSIRLDITAQKALESMVIKDEMTGLYNRRFYNQNFHKELQRAKRHNQWLCMVMVDADNFKKYNDTYGHQAGDTVIKSIASVLQQTFQRAGDFAFRLGGEEFAVLFEVEKPEDGELLADKLCKAMFDQNIAHSGNPPWSRVTISVGVMLIDPQLEYAEEELYKYADEALYRAKELGRNRYEIAGEEEVDLF